MRHHESDIRHPSDTVTGRDLVQISLRHLSKSLDLDSASSRTTISMYLRWLEVHRVENTKITEHWEDTLIRWVQSLKSRGFTKTEIQAEVARWKEKNEPFRSNHKRYPPLPKDVVKAFEEDQYFERNGESWRPVDKCGESARYSIPSWKDHSEKETQYIGVPPGDYICNRCHKRGMCHHLNSIAQILIRMSRSLPASVSYEYGLSL